MKRLEPSHIGAVIGALLSRSFRRRPALPLSLLDVAPRLERIARNAHRRTFGGRLSPTGLALEGAARFLRWEMGCGTVRPRALEVVLRELDPLIGGCDNGALSPEDCRELAELERFLVNHRAGLVASGRFPIGK